MISSKSTNHFHVIDSVRLSTPAERFQHIFAGHCHFKSRPCPITIVYNKTICSQVIDGVHMGGVTAAVAEASSKKLPPSSFRFFSG